MHTLPRGIIAALGAIVVVFAGAAAQEPLRWERVAELLANHPQLLAGEAAREAAAAAARAAAAYPRPEAHVSRGRAEAHAGDERETVWGAEASLPLRFLGVRASAAAALRAERDAVAAEVELDRQELLRLWKAHFYRIAFGQRAVAVLEAEQEQLEALLASVRRRIDAGEARPTEAARIEIEVERGRLDLMRARRELAADRAVLAAGLGDSLPESFTVAADLDHLPPLPARATVLARARQHHGGLRASAHRVQADESRLRHERRQRWPALAIGGFYEHELDAAAYGARLEFELPLWNWNGAAIDAARAELRAARQRYDAAQREAHAQVIAVHAAAKQAYAEAASYRETIVPKASASAAALEEMYRIGEVGLIDVLESRRNRIAVEQALLASMLAAQRAYLDLVFWMGGEHD